MVMWRVHEERGEGKASVEVGIGYLFAGGVKGWATGLSDSRKASPRGRGGKRGGVEGPWPGRGEGC